MTNKEKREQQKKIHKAMSILGKRSAKAREGKTDYSKLAKKRWKEKDDKKQKE